MTGSFFRSSTRYTPQHQMFFFFFFFFIRAGKGLSPRSRGKTGQSGSREQLVSCLRGDVAPPRRVRRLPRRPLCHLRARGRKAGVPSCPPRTGWGRGRGSVGPLRDDRGVRGPRRRGGEEPVEPLLEHSSACNPQSGGGPGVSACQLLLTGCSSFGG